MRAITQSGNDRGRGVPALRAGKPALHACYMSAHAHAALLTFQKNGIGPWAMPVTFFRQA